VTRALGKTVRTMSIIDGDRSSVTSFT